MKLLFKQKENKNSFKLFKLLFSKVEQNKLITNEDSNAVEINPTNCTHHITEKSSFERNIYRYSVGSVIKIDGYEYIINKIPQISKDKYIPFFLLVQNGFIQKIGYSRRGYFND